MANHDVLRKCQLIAKDKSFKNLYNQICAYDQLEAAVWLEDGVEKSMSFRELASQSDRYAVYLSEKFGKSGRVCISMDSCKEWFPLFWGLVRSGHDVLTVDASASDEKLASMMDQTSCTMLVASKERNIGSKYSQMVISELIDAPAVESYEPVWGHDIALCTSGTTSDSRIFVYDEETICYLALFSAKVFRENHLLIDNENFRTLAFLPFHHILGFAAIFIWCHFLGYTTVYLKDRTPQTILQTVKQCRVSQIITVPLLANNICKGLKAKIEKEGFVKKAAFRSMLHISLAVQKFAPKTGLKLAANMFKTVREQLLGTNIKSIVLGGGHTDPESLRMFNALGYFTICGYGMTETAITGFESSYKLSNRLKGSVGEPMEHTEYRIKGGGESGELLVRGKGLHDGRFVDGRLMPADIDSEGWFATGDVMRINKAERQYLIEGRTKEVIINESGENVYPDELEDAFSGLEGVEQYTILGLGRKDKTHYEDISLVMNVGGKMVDENYVQRLADGIRTVNKDIPVFKRLSRALVTAEKLPTANGFKVKRLALKSMIQDGTIPVRDLDLSVHSEGAGKPQTPVPSKPAEDSLTREIRTKIINIYSEILNMPAKDISPEANFIEDFGGDSLQVLSITVRAEEEFGIFIPAESYVRCATVDGATELVRELILNTTAEKSFKLVERVPVTSFEDSEEYKHFKHRIDSLVAAGDDNPYFVNHDSPLLDTSVIRGQKVIDFGSYNYVGMSGRKEVSEAAKAAIDKYGTSASGSRLLAGEKPIHGELERELAEWKHAESALVCVGGHSTNVTVVGNFCGKNDLIIYDALAHNSVEQGCRLSEAMIKTFPHNDIVTLEKILKAQRKYFEKVLIVIEGVYSMDGDISDVPAFVNLKKKYGCFLMVDEAHSACVLGKTGGGVDEYFGLAPDDIDIKMGTLSKGLGTCGGYLAGRKCVIDYLRYNLPGFVFSVGISPALAAGSLAAIRLLRGNPEIMERIHRNIECFAIEARKRRLDIGLAGKSAILPVLVGKDEDAFALSNEMLHRGVFVPPAVYPAVPKNKARLRFDVISEHKPEQISYALDVLLEAAEALGIKLPLKD